MSATSTVGADSLAARLGTTSRGGDLGEETDVSREVLIMNGLKPSIAGVVLAAVVAITLGAVSATAQSRRSTEPSGGTEMPSAESRSPQEAFKAGLYDEAATGFSKRAERRPDDPKAQFNLGSALHQLSDYDGAKAAFERALQADETALRAKALYDLGNTAYRQGQLEEAITRYSESLELAPDDDDAKHNLEFVQRELERRQEQAEQRQQSQQDQDQDSEDQQQDQEGQQNQEGDQQSNSDSDQRQEQQDSDGDGLTDQQEREAENPTDPNRRDSDGDGRSDGEEDKNRNGRVDEGESNPNRPDEAPVPEPGQAEDQSASNEPQSENQGEGQQPIPSTLTPEQAQRLLAALQDQRPPSGRKLPESAQTAKSAKDW